MYTEYYQLHTMPFENTPDPRFYFASDQHREALAAIEYVIRMRKGTVLVTGSIGAGKTTIGQTMMQRCQSAASIVQLVHGHVTSGELIGHLLRSLGTGGIKDVDHARQLEHLRAHLVSHAQASRPVVVLVDEAQTLSDDALEELRLVSNFDTATQKLMQLVLVGQPELRTRIAQPRFDALRQRIVLAKQLSPLDRADAEAYIHHRLRVASIDPDQPAVRFNPDAVTRIFASTHGTPRLINAICDNCLLMGYVQQTQCITADVVGRVVQDMVPRFEDAYTTAPRLAG